MSETAMRDFLAQFSKSRESVEAWPPWMKASAKIATASFPKPQQREVKDSELPQPTTKN